MRYSGFAAAKLGGQRKALAIAGPVKARLGKDLREGATPDVLGLGEGAVRSNDDRLKRQMPNVRPQSESISDSVLPALLRANAT